MFVGPSAPKDDLSQHAVWR